MCNKYLVFAASALFGIASVPALADSVTYAITVDTSSQLAKTGYIELQLEPGTLSSPMVTATITGFSGAVLNPADPGNDSLGDVTGALPGTLTLVNHSTDDYTEALLFGNSITFDLNFSGPGVNPAGNAGGTSGTTFVLDFLDSTQSTYLLSSDPNATSTSITDPLWAVGVVDISNTGVVTAYANPGPGGAPSPLTFSPEPASWTLLSAALVLLGLAACFSKRAANRRP